MAAKLYTGTSSLTERSDTPFTTVHRSGLAVRSDGTVAACTATAGDAQVVATAGPGDSYAAWTDKTGSLDDTAAVAAVEWIE